MESDGASHEKVVVFADDSSVGAVGFAFVDEEFVEATAVAFGVEVFAYDLDESRYNHRFGGDVGMETVFARDALTDFVFGLTSGVEVGVDGGDLVEDILRLVATFYLPFAVVGFESVGFDNEERVVVERGDLGGFPSEAVDVAVAVPLSNDGRSAAFNHVKAVNDEDNRPVGFGGAASDVDDSKVAVGDVDIVVDFGERPNG